MFHPMAFTVVIALLGAMMLSLTFVPAAWRCSRRQSQEKETSRARRQARLRPMLALGMRNKSRRCAVALSHVVVAAFAGASRMGSEFIPSLDEGDIALHALRIPGHQPDAGGRDAGRARARAQAVPEVDKVFAKIGTAEVATDPMPPNVADTSSCSSRATEWPDPDKRSKAELVADASVRAKVPGNNYEFTQPIQMRFNELISGVRSDVAVKVFGDDLDDDERDRRARSPKRAQTGRPARPTSRSSRPPAADADHHATARRWRATASMWTTCRRSSPPRWAAVAGRSSRATAASTSSCACPSGCAATSTRWSACRSAARARDGESKPANRTAGAADAPRLRAAGRSREDRNRAGPEPDQPRERQAPRRRHGQRARPRPGLFRRRGRSSGWQAVEVPAATGPTGAAPSSSCISASSACRSWCRSLLLIFGCCSRLRQRRRMRCSCSPACRCADRRRRRSGCATSRSRSRPASASSRCPAWRCSTAW
jgi:hypothetical protein